MKSLKEIINRLSQRGNSKNTPPSSIVQVTDPAECPFKDSPISCSGCRDIFHISRDGERIRYDGRACYNKILKTELFKQSGLPELASSRTFDNAEVDKHNYKLVNWLKAWQPGERGAFIFGSYGIGKTYLMHCFANRLISELQPVSFVEEIDLYGELKSSYNEETDETEGEILGKYGNYPVLILDDVGKQNPSPWASRILYHIINKRLVAGKPTFLTSNYDLDDLEAKLGEHGRGIVSRLFELCQVWELKGEDRRWISVQKKALPSSFPSNFDK